MIEVCSIYNRRQSIFEEGSLDVTENAYFGIDCDCGGTEFKPKDGSDCGHTNFLTDPKVINFFLNSAVSSTEDQKYHTTGAFLSMTEEQLKSYEDNCTLFTSN